MENTLTINTIHLGKVADDLETYVGSKLANLRACFAAALESVNESERAGNDDEAGTKAIAFLNLFCDTVEHADDDLRNLINMMRQ